jgi:predicted MFS family arabinose efflux permease
MPFGSALVLATSPLAIAAAGWRGIWIAVAFAAAACALLLYSQRRHFSGIAGGTRRSLANIRASLAQPVPWWLGTAFALHTVQNIGVFLWLPTYLIETRGMPPTEAALLSALSIFVNCFGNVLGGWLIQRRVPRGRIIGAAFIATAFLFAGMFSAALPDGARYALVLVYNIACGVIPAAALSGGARYARSTAEVGAIQGLIVQITNVGIVFGPPAVAAVVTYAHSWDAALWVMLIVAAAGVGVSRVIAHYERRDAA